ncbi:MAG: GIY-YIG nuclease family protein [Gammaproteobacteria bacterium]|nr:MAG: GIY-YIG nuclease family protein [Gammaproteobacteria bacterium]
MPREKRPAIYMLANRKHGTLYVGITSDLVGRVWQHKQGVVDGFSRRYGLKQLVYYELHESMESAILREKCLKKWNRVWKIELIESTNPEWTDLWDSLF